MKYTVGYLGNNEYIEEYLNKYYNPGEEDKIKYINLSDISYDMLEATSFNGIIFDTSAHNVPKQNNLIDKIITSNDEIDILPILNNNNKDNSNEKILDEIELIRKNYNVSSQPYLINTKEDAHIFIEGIFSTLSEKTIRHMEKIHNFMLNSQKDVINVVDKFASLVEIKDEYTEYHSLRVANYAKQIAIKLGLPENEVETIYHGGRLHDIGKIVIIDNVLKKTDKLNDKEYSNMQMHAEIGESILRNTFPHGQFEDVKAGVRHHHERYDGFGYPDKISGEDIPLISRILCIADSFDAMTTKREYNIPKTFEETLADLTRNAGKQFDPNLIEIFIDLLKNEPEKLDITIDHNVILTKYATKADTIAKQHQIEKLKAKENEQR